jgi:hypothetical protein
MGRGWRCDLIRTRGGSCPVRYCPLVPGIFLERGEGELVHLQGETYESENQLQTLVEKHSELLLVPLAGAPTRGG